MTDKETVEMMASMAGVTAQTLRKKLIRTGLDALISEAERLSFAERFGSNTTLTSPPIEARFVAQAYKEFE
jgi:hypothetical protein